MQRISNVSDVQPEQRAYPPGVKKTELSLLKPLILGSLVFVTLGVFLAMEILSRFGLEDNYAAVFAVALVVAVLTISRNLLMIALVLLGVVAINLPDATLASYYLDRDILLAFVCALILVPNVYNLVFK